MSLEEQIENKFKTALKQKDKIQVSTLRMLKAEIINIKLEQNKKALKDEEIIKIIQRQVKQHKDSIEQFEKGKRQDLAEKEKKELAILSSYMPEQLSAEELKKIIEDVIKELEATSKSEMGKVMKSVMVRVKGRADGKKISQIVSNLLR
ncbi:MAG: GatB/YqeY domain-containing protein [Candidatus Omnitrophota bacterium]|nr:MAG: GatB/YqeY domain-containing protein [Candidatus Omnitrophota bacterium]